MISDSLLEMSAALGEKLMAKGWRVSCAESCTAGGIGYAITSAAGSSGWFDMGFITYSNAAKEQLVNVNKVLLDEHGAVSEPVVRAMVKGAAKNASTQVAVAVSGIAGPGGGSAEKLVGLVWFGFKIGDKLLSEKLVFAGDRDAIRHKTIHHALSRLLEEL